MNFDFSDDQKLLKEIDRILIRRSADVRKLVETYRVPIAAQ